MAVAYGQVGIFVAVGIGFVLVALAASALIQTRTPSAAKSMVYECGEVPLGKAWFNFNPRFYVVALIFLVFDVEIVFMFPVAAVFRDWVNQGAAGIAVAEIFVFVGILLVALAYVWRKGDLDWVKQVRHDNPLS
jgi:NADH-quinone oxidoreductase subunit A